MRIVIVGGGMVGLTLARMLRMRGQDPVVLERMPAGRYVPRPFMLGFQGFAPLEDMGVLGHVREAGWDIAPEANGDPAAICVDVGIVLAAIGEDVSVNHGESVVELLREGERVVGVVSEGPGGRTEIPADLVVACDGIMSPVRTMAGLEAEFSPLVEAALSYLSPVVIDRSFHMDYLADGGLILLMGWPQGSSGSRSIDKVGAEAALAPGVEAFKRSFAELMPEAEIPHRHHVPRAAALRGAARAALPALVDAGGASHRRFGAFLRARDRRWRRHRTGRRPRAGGGGGPPSGRRG